jgi:hypothetical protein
MVDARHDHDRHVHAVAGHHDRHDVALPNIQKQFHVSLSDLQWVIDAYALTLAAGLLTTGAFADLWGRKGQLVSPGPASVNHS